MPYHLAILHKVGPGERGRVEAGLEERAVQGRGDTASKLQGSPFTLGPTTTSSRL